MVAKLVGMRSVDFVAEDGRRVSGFSLYLGTRNENVIGYQVDRVFVSADKVDSKVLKVDTEINVDFNSKGRVVAVSAI